MQSSSHTSVDFDLEQIFNDEAQYDINNWDDNIFSSSDDFSVDTTLYGEKEEEANTINIRIRKKVLGTKSIDETLELCQSDYDTKKLF